MSKSKLLCNPCTHMWKGEKDPKLKKIKEKGPKITSKTIQRELDHMMNCFEKKKNDRLKKLSQELNECTEAKICCKSSDSIEVLYEVFLKELDQNRILRKKIKTQSVCSKSKKPKPEIKEKCDCYYCWKPKLPFVDSLKNYCVNHIHSNTSFMLLINDYDTFKNECRPKRKSHGSTSKKKRNKSSYKKDQETCFKFIVLTPVASNTNLTKAPCCTGRSKKKHEKSIRNKKYEKSQKISLIIPLSESHSEPRSTSSSNSSKDCQSEQEHVQNFKCTRILNENNINLIELILESESEERNNGSQDLRISHNSQRKSGALVSQELNSESKIKRKPCNCNSENENYSGFQMNREQYEFGNKVKQKLEKLLECTTVKQREAEQTISSCKCSRNDLKILEVSQDDKLKKKWSEHNKPDYRTERSFRRRSRSPMINNQQSDKQNEPNQSVQERPNRFAINTSNLSPKLTPQYRRSQDRACQTNSSLLESLYRRFQESEVCQSSPSPKPTLQYCRPQVRVSQSDSSLKFTPQYHRPQTRGCQSHSSLKFTPQYHRPQTRGCQSHSSLKFTPQYHRPQARGCQSNFSPKLRSQYHRPQKSGVCHSNASAKLRSQYSSFQESGVCQCDSTPKLSSQYRSQASKVCQSNSSSKLRPQYRRSKECKVYQSDSSPKLRSHYRSQASKICQSDSSLKLRSQYRRPQESKVFQSILSPKPRSQYRRSQESKVFQSNLSPKPRSQYRRSQENKVCQSNLSLKPRSQYRRSQESKVCQSNLSLKPRSQYRRSQSSTVFQSNLSPKPRSQYRRSEESKVCQSNLSPKPRSQYRRSQESKVCQSDSCPKLRSQYRRFQESKVCQCDSSPKPRSQYRFQVSKVCQSDSSPKLGSQYRRSQECKVCQSDSSPKLRSQYRFQVSKVCQSDSSPKLRSQYRFQVSKVCQSDSSPKPRSQYRRSQETKVCQLNSSPKVGSQYCRSEDNRVSKIYTNFQKTILKNKFEHKMEPQLKEIPECFGQATMYLENCFADKPWVSRRESISQLKGSKSEDYIEPKLEKLSKCHIARQLRTSPYNCYRPSETSEEVQTFQQGPEYPRLQRSEGDGTALSSHQNKGSQSNQTKSFFKSKCILKERLSDRLCSTVEHVCGQNRLCQTTNEHLCAQECASGASVGDKQERRGTYERDIENFINELRSKRRSSIANSKVDSKPKFKRTDSLLKAKLQSLFPKIISSMEIRSESNSSGSFKNTSALRRGRQTLDKCSLDELSLKERDKRDTPARNVDSYICELQEKSRTFSLIHAIANRIKNFKPALKLSNILQGMRHE